MQTAQTPQADASELYEGGFYAGIISINGERHVLIVAPKAEGESERMPWGEAGKTIEANSCFDGQANTQAMADAGSELAKWAQGLDINGYTDWYIPSRDELEILYRNLKPQDSDNCATFRDGDNPSSEPPGYPYTEAEPRQTSAANFQHGGAQAFEPTWYWSSSQGSANGAWGQFFGNGIQVDVLKLTAFRARAVRRFISH